MSTIQTKFSNPLPGLIYNNYSVLGRFKVDHRLALCKFVTLLHKLNVKLSDILLSQTAILHTA